MPELMRQAGPGTAAGVSDQVKAFEPADLPALFSLDQTAQFQRDVQHAKEQTTDFWGEILDHIEAEPEAESRGTLCLNWRNPVMRRLLRVRQRAIVRPVAELTYVQGVLQGHFPLGTAERQVLGEGLTDLMKLALKATHEEESN